jgi:hypothetical protein
MQMEVHELQNNYSFKDAFAGRNLLTFSTELFILKFPTAMPFSKQMITVSGNTVKSPSSGMYAELDVPVI